MYLYLLYNRITRAKLIAMDRVGLPLQLRWEENDLHFDYENRNKKKYTKFDHHFNSSPTCINLQVVQTYPKLHISPNQVPWDIDLSGT